MMRIAIVGIGGVGGYIGAKFCSLKEADPKKYEIVFIARGKHAEAVKAEGLKVIEDEGAFTARPSAVCSAEEAEGTFDLVLLCVKSYDIEAAVTALQHAIHPDTVIIPFANGVDNADTVRRMVDAKVLNGCAYILSHIREPGVIRKQGKVFAALFGDPEYIGESLHIGYLFKDAGLRAMTPDAIETALWKKYLFISAFATLTSYYDTSIRTVCDAHYSVAKAVLGEIAAVAAARRIDLTGETEKALESAANLPPEASTSMHLDFQHRRRTELEALTGYVVKEAERLGVAAPQMEKMYGELRERLQRESSET
jgi:2-dehydropantoate 2-reductase